VRKTARAGVLQGPRTLWVCRCRVVFAESDQGCERRLPTGLSCGCFRGLAARGGGLRRFRRRGRDFFPRVRNVTSSDACCGHLSDDVGWLGMRLHSRQACPSSDGSGHRARRCMFASQPPGATFSSRRLQLELNATCNEPSGSDV